MGGLVDSCDVCAKFVALDAPDAMFGSDQQAAVRVRHNETRLTTYIQRLTRAIRRHIAIQPALLDINKAQRLFIRQPDRPFAEQAIGLPDQPDFSAHAVAFGLHPQTAYQST